MQNILLQLGLAVVVSSARISAEGRQIVCFLRKMSQHPSLKVGGAAEAKRTVLTRYERVELLRKRGELKEGDRITGLKKTKPEE